MVNIAVIGKRGSGKTSFLLNAIAPLRFTLSENPKENYQYYFEDEITFKQYDKKKKQITRKKQLSQTNGISETRIALGTDTENLGNINIYEFGGNIKIDLNSNTFEQDVQKIFASMIGGYDGVFFDGYIFVEPAEEFGISTGVSFPSFSKKFSQYLLLSQRINKPILMLCTKNKDVYSEQLLYERFLDNFALKSMAHYAFFDFDEETVKSKYILTRFLREVAYYTNDRMYSHISFFCNDLYNYIEQGKE